MEPFQVFAIRYGHLGNRHPGQSYILADPHEYGPDLDYFIWVLRRGDCMFIVDTGFSAESAIRRKREQLRDPAGALRLLDIDPEKVSDVILTHLHYDHAGNLDRFPAARYHVQDREVAYATGRCMCHPFLREAFDLENALEMVRTIYAGRAVFHDGDSEVAPGLTLHRVGGHTAGLQILRVWTERGWVVLAADASHLYSNFQQGRVFPVVYNVAEMLEGYRLLYRLADSPDHIVPGHDPLVMKYYPALRPELEGIVVRLDVPPSSQQQLLIRSACNACYAYGFGMREERMSQRNVGFVGVGRMGGPMCRRLIEAGNSLTIFDKSDAAMRPLEALGAKRVDSPAAVASAAEIVLASLPTPPIVHAAALGPGGVIEGSRVKIFIDVSTTGSAYAKRVAEGLKAKNIAAVDAPVSGGVAGAEKGTLAVMVSCDDQTFANVKPVVEVIGKVFHVGKQPGQGQTMKLLNNLLSATAMAISSEAVVMGVKAGLDPQQVIDVINAGSGRNTATMDKIPRCVLNRKFDFGFAMGLLNKDVRLCMEEAEAMGVPMVVGSAVRQMLAIGAASEGADADMTELIKVMEGWAGVTVQAS